VRASPRAADDYGEGEEVPSSRASATTRQVEVCFHFPSWGGEGTAVIVGAHPTLGRWDPDGVRLALYCTQSSSSVQGSNWCASVASDLVFRV